MAGPAPRRRVGRRPASAGQATQAPELPARRSAGLGPRPPAACPVWTARDGTDHATIDALRARRLDTLAIDEPTDGELTAEMPHELERSRRHLRAILESYWDPHLATRPQRPR